MSENLSEQINELRGEFLEAKEEILEDLECQLIDTKSYLRDYLIDALDKFLAEKSQEWQESKSVLVEHTGVLHANYWRFVSCGGRLILAVLSLPLYLIGVGVAFFRKKHK